MEIDCCRCASSPLTSPSKICEMEIEVRVRVGVRVRVRVRALSILVTMYLLTAT